MHERRRLHYLSILGIDNYVPCRLLSCAPAPVLLSAEHLSAEHLAGEPPLLAVPNTDYDGLTEKQPRDIGSEHPPVSSPAVAKSFETADTAESSQPSLAEPPSQEAVRNKAAASINELTQTQVVAAQDLQFVLNVWRIGSELLVIDSRQPGAAYPTDRLLHNILRALGHYLPQLPPSDIIRWPLFLNPRRFLNPRQQHHDQDAQQARAMVHAYIHAQIEQYSVKALLLMGDHAARFGLDTQVGEAPALVDASVIDTRPWDIPVVLTHSLFTLLQEPHLKAQAWQALQKIILRPQSVNPVN